MNPFQLKHKTMIIRMPKEVDHHIAEQFRHRADQLITQENIKRIEFDFRDTQFMDSSGIGVVMGRYQTIRLLGGTVAATHVNERIYRIFQLAGLPKVIEIQKEQVWNSEE